MSDSNKPDTSKEPEIRYVPVQFIEGYAPQSISDEVEIDLMDILKRIWQGRLTIIKITAVFAILGALYALGSPNEYTTTTKLLPEVQQTNNIGRFGGLAAQFGLGGTTSGATNDVLPPQIYPEILNSTDFLHEIIKKSVYYKEIQDSITIQEFYNEHKKSNPFVGYTVGLPFKLLALIRSAPDAMIVDDFTTSETYKRIPPREMAAIGGVRQAVVSKRDQMTGLLTITVTTQSPEITAQLTNFVTSSLSDYLIAYRTEKSRQNLHFLERRHAEARESFVMEQEGLAAFRDQNRGNLSELARVVEQNIQSEYNVKFNVYNSLTEQLEQARIRLQQDTPVISIVQQGIYPNRKSGPNRMLIIIIYVIIGASFSTVWLLLGSKIRTVFVHS